VKRRNSAAPYIHLVDKLKNQGRGNSGGQPGGEQCGHTKRKGKKKKHKRIGVMGEGLLTIPGTGSEGGLASLKKSLMNELSRTSFNKRPLSEEEKKNHGEEIDPQKFIWLKAKDYSIERRTLQEGNQRRSQTAVGNRTAGSSKQNHPPCLIRDWGRSVR